MLRAGNGGPNDLDVVHPQLAVATLAAAALLVDTAGGDLLPAHDRERIDPEERAREVLANVRVHPLDERDHGDQERDADADPEQREERLQLLRPNLLERESDALPESHRPRS